MLNKKGPVLKKKLSRVMQKKQQQHGQQNVKRSLSKDVSTCHPWASDNQFTDSVLHDWCNIDTKVLKVSFLLSSKK